MHYHSVIESVGADNNATEVIMLLTVTNYFCSNQTKRLTSVTLDVSFFLGNDRTISIVKTGVINRLAKESLLLF